MLRGPLGDPDAATRFSGHETFPLRRLWLRKAYMAVREAEGAAAARPVFDKDEGLVRFGVGKNMVWAIRHWAQLCGVVEEAGKQGRYRAGPVGHMDNTDVRWRAVWGRRIRPHNPEKGQEQWHSLASRSKG